jgi:glycosyltransferase involved in cell wall biosynthesis
MSSSPTQSANGKQRDSSVVVIIPAQNEEQSISRVIAEIPRPLVSSIIVVDNGSSDRTAQVARLAGAMVIAEPRRGYGYACLAGIEHAMKESPAAIVFLDGDYSDFPGDLPLLVAGIDDGYDLVIGSRILGRHERGALLPQALFGNWLATTLIRLFWGYRFTDLGPFRAIRTEALVRMHMSDPTYGWTVEMQIKAAKLKLRCTEVPVRYRKRIGRSKVTGTLAGTVKASAKILTVIFLSLFGET